MNFFKYRLVRTCFKSVSATLFLCQSLVAIADDSVITTSVGKYTLSVIQISSDAIVERLGSQPWWGDAALAEEFATLGKLAAKKPIQPCMSASFTYGLDSSSIKEAIWYQCASNGKDIADKGSVNMRGETNLSGIRSYVVATLVGEGSEDTASGATTSKTETKTEGNSVITTSVGKYTLSVIQISSDAIVERLGSQPWWGDAALAEEFATLGKLAAKKPIQPCMSASFTYGLDSSSIKEAIWYQCASNGKDIADKGSVNMRGETNLSGIRSYVKAVLIPPLEEKTISSTTGETKRVSIGGGILTNKNEYRKNPAVGETVKILFTLSPAIEDIEAQSEIFIAVSSGSNYFTLTPTGLKLWDGQLSTREAFANIVLKAHMKIDVLGQYGGELKLTSDMIGTYQFYLAYTNASGGLIFNQDALILNVQ